MTMRDPDLNTRRNMRDPDLRTPEIMRSSSNMGWILGAVLLLLGAVAFIWSGTSTNTASNTGTPATTSGSASTTGSGSAGPASNAPASNPAR